MATVGAIRDGLAAKLATIEGLRVHDVIPDDMMPPAVVIRPAQGSFVRYRRTHSGSTEMTIIVTIVVSAGWSRTAQDALDEYMATSGPMSVLAALDGPVTGVSDYVQVVEATNWGEVEVAGVTYFGVDFVVEVLA